jgi:hypothetical protein
MPHQLGVTIRAQVAADQFVPLRDWLAKVAHDRTTDSLFAFGHMRGLHFAKLFALEGGTDPGGPSIPASLVLMTEVDAPLRSHLAELIDVGGAGIDQAFGYCEDYPGPGAHRRARVAWLRRHLVRASAVYVNTVGRGLQQIREEARLRDALEDYLDQGDWDGRAPDDVRRELQAHVAGRADLAWAMTPAAPPSLRFRVREAAHEVGVPLLLAPLLPALPFVLPPWAVLLRLSELRERPVTQRPTLEHLNELAVYEDFVTQNPFAVVGFVRPGLLRLVTFRAVMSAIDYAVRHVYNHADLAGIKTIHFARWVPLDGWRRMTFASNYDGAVEAYNDDFIDQVWWGLNAAFGSAAAYPPTRWVFWGGAKYEQQFKSTLRIQQVPVPVWYTAYPALSAVNIENNARIRAGLRGEMNPADAEQWLSRL